MTQIYNSGWKAARRRAAARYETRDWAPVPQGFRSIRVHDLKHTYGIGCGSPASASRTASSSSGTKRST